MCTVQCMCGVLVIALQGSSMCVYVWSVCGPTGWLWGVRSSCDTCGRGVSVHNGRDNPAGQQCVCAEWL